MLVQAAWAASHTKNSYLGARYRRLARRKGRKRALVAVAHTLMVIVYHVLKKGEPYKELGGDYLDQRLFRDAVLESAEGRRRGEGGGAVDFGVFGGELPEGIVVEVLVVVEVFAAGGEAKIRWASSPRWGCVMNRGSRGSGRASLRASIRLIWRSASRVSGEP